MEDGEEALRKKQRQEGNEKKSSLKIPSYQEAFLEGGSTSSSTPTPTPQPDNPSFSQAFAFIRNSEFYTPPPPPPSPQEGALRHVAAQSEASPSSSSSSSVFSSASPAIQNRNAILVSHRQKGNPLLKHVRNVRWMFADIVPDYLMGQSSCALYLSLRYHLLHPDYLYFRIRELQKNYKLRVVMCHIDVEDVVKPLLEVTRTALFHDCTLLCGWSLEECGRYLETIKVYENKSADSIREQTDKDYLSRLTHALTTVRRVNKTDVVTLGSTFGSLSHIMDASMEDLARCPGIGERKVKRLYDTFHEPFRRVSCRPAAVPEAPVAKNAEEPSLIDEHVEVGEKEADSTKHGKEPDVTIRSALNAAFAKYSDKINKQKDKMHLVEHEEGSNVASSDAEV